ncbi:Sporulation related domain-containing protein [Salinihabitans flavidus]|uniref:Sporulation related domain-containing protein n=1 Tax=Salinihabitans flavidus TaxID=569882 RepID=A0A1H8WAU0_9RHOB|nr:SPOR domain-containing protein [Salinihabitans flavidus]SEP24776.1 Sporulation related domain-containing protein [Salinihabitans flavidus]
MQNQSFRAAAGSKGSRALVWLCAAALLSGCEDAGDFNPFRATSSEQGETRSVKLVERDVEAPEVFSVTEAGLWDGRPSLGGVWAAHPDVKDPERVIIRNNSNGKFVIGALFRREREIPGPRLQISSDAAAAIGMLAGQPVELNVTALRREEVPDEEAGDGELPAPADVQEDSLDPVAAAGAAIEKAEDGQQTPTASGETTAETPAPKPDARPKASSLSKPYIQIGIFSVESNAKNAAGQMRNAGMVPLIREQSLQGKTYWRVLVGPATTASERAQLLKKIKGTGFTDAYAVDN